MSMSPMRRVTRPAASNSMISSPTTWAGALGAVGSISEVGKSSTVRKLFDMVKYSPLATQLGIVVKECDVDRDAAGGWRERCRVVRRVPASDFVAEDVYFHHSGEPFDI